MRASFHTVAGVSGNIGSGVSATGSLHLDAVEGNVGRGRLRGEHDG